MLETLLKREIRRVLDSAVDGTNADYLAGQLIALRWALAKVRRRGRRVAVQKETSHAATCQ